MRVLLILAALVAGAWLVVQERAARAEEQLTAIAFESDDPRDAPALLEAARRLNPDRRPDLFEGVILARRGDFRGAVAVFRRVTRAEPQNIEAWGLLASVAQRVDPALARTARARARALAPPVK